MFLSDVSSLAYLATDVKGIQLNMIEQVADNIYRVDIPLPQSPLKALNSYFLKGRERNLIVDTGFNHQDCLTALEDAAAILEIDLRRTDFFITHLHADHLGLVSRLNSGQTRIYLGEEEVRLLQEKGRWEEMFKFARFCGFPQDSLEILWQEHPAFKYQPDYQVKFREVRQNQVLEIAGYSFVCLPTPGHSPGHTCLYEPNHRILIAGDHILEDISPNLQLWNRRENPLAQYLESLRLVADLDIDLVLPGHRRIIRDCAARIKTLQHHHQERLEEILSLLKRGNQDPYTVASRLTWEVGPIWTDLPVVHQWFATGEAIAHLRHLEESGLVQANRSRGLLRFALRS